MSEAKHTPGPWTAEATTSSEFVTRAIRGACDELVAHVGVQGYKNVPTVFQDVANARLIAAAPELLDALRELAAIGEGGIIERRETGKPTWHALNAVRDIARAAITKAGVTL